MKVLIVGGTGFIGGHTSLFFHDLGHEVTLLSRSAQRGTSRLNELRFVQGNYIEDDFSDGRLEGFDWLVFCAGSDLGNYPTDGSVSQADFFHRANIESLPRFFEQAKSAGIARAVYMGSFYSFVAPANIEKIPYVRSRHLSDAAVRSLSSPGFNVCSCALPWIVGHTPGMDYMHWHLLAKFAKGESDFLPSFVPPGGGNYMSVRSVAQAMLGGLERGESGKSYLVGDVNMSWKDFYEAWCRTAGRPRELEVRDDLEHPILSREIISYLEGRTPDYEPPAEETALLGYERGVMPQVIEDCVRYYGALPL